MVMSRCQLAGYSVAFIFLYVYPFALDCKLFVGNNFPRRSPYTCISLCLYGCLLFASIFSIDVLGGCPFLPLSLLPPPCGKGRGREPAPTTGPSGIAGGSGGGKFPAPDWFAEGISMVFMLCTSMSFLSLHNLCHMSMGTSTNLLTVKVCLLTVQ